MVNNFLVCVRCMTYNHAPYIEDTLKGFCIQKTEFPFVCAIVDDASTDGEQDIITNYLVNNFDLSNQSIARKEETKDYLLFFSQHKKNTMCYFAVVLLKYNHYHKKDRLGYIAEWLNTAKYQSLCEGDDYWTAADKLQRQVDFLESHQDYSMCYAKCRYYFQKTNKLEKNSWGGKSVTFKDLLRGNTVPTLTTVMRNSIVNEYRKIYIGNQVSANWRMGDYPLWLFCSIKGKIHFMDWEVGVYRIHGDSASHSQSMQKKMQLSMSMVDIMEYFNEEYKGGYSSIYFNRLRDVLKLRTYAIYGNFREYLQEWFSIVRNRPVFLLDKRAYKYFTFFLFPSLQNTRK